MRNGPDEGEGRGACLLADDQIDADLTAGGEGRGRRPLSRKRGPSPAKHWRDYATTAEATDLEGLFKTAADLDRRRERLSHAIRLIRDRCIARRRYAGEHKPAAREAA